MHGQRGGGWAKGLTRTPRTTDDVFTYVSRLVRTIRGCPVARPAGLLTAPVLSGSTRGKDIPTCLCVCGEHALSVCRAHARAWRVVCCLVLQAPAERMREPDSEPARAVAGLDTPP